ncbi:hypothetical protein N7509_001175 [Penicillium cosmopolitanum]|uniref:UDP-N-acetylmuramate--L-alanine ligase n=1 Tax=Penicillium cosmopolitanum TaxID=1131564 RepID=A0A9W9WBZ3_9EURO|nr:uncharacterized protein N7509_001175 [Penicillium cosmopolitanum]KAJ5414548.1 hypothetical protein N7509_001175 [Penicillium cosmopolitanum]
MNFLSLKERLLNDRTPSMPGFPPSIGLIHFVCIGGHGMSGIALILHQLGYQVQGSDIKESDNTRRLRAAGVTVFIGHDTAYVRSAKLVVSSGQALAIKWRTKENIEVEAARANAIPVIHRAKMLAEIMRNKKAIAIGGSHGKSTTTSMLAAIMRAADLDPTVITGATMSLYDSNAYLGTGEWIVVEADESDGSFLELPHLVTVVTNIDSDHINFWKEERHTREAFSKFVDNMPFFGLGVLCIDDPGVKQIMSSVQDQNIVTYGLSEEADVRAEDPIYSLDGCSFVISVRDRQRECRTTIGRITVNALGVANVQNALAALAIGIEIGIEVPILSQALSTFPGLQQRFERIGVINGITIINDHAAHTAEIRATLNMAKQAGAKRIIAVHQSCSRASMAEDWVTDGYPSAFEGTSHIIIGRAEGVEEIQAAQGQDTLVQSLRNFGHSEVTSMDDSTQLPNLVSQHGTFTVRALEGTWSDMLGIDVSLETFHEGEGAGTFATWPIA